MVSEAQRRRIYEGIVRAVAQKGYAAATDLKRPPLSVVCTSAGGWAPGSDLKVTATYPYSINLFGIGLVSGNLKSTQQERVE